MKIAVYVIRFLLALIFIYAGIEVGLSEKTKKPFFEKIVQNFPVILLFSCGFTSKAGAGSAARVGTTPSRGRQANN